MGATDYLPRKMERTPFTLLPQTRERTVHRPYLLLAGLQFADVALTWFILASWSERAEGNPLAAWLLDGVGLEAGLLLLLSFKLAAVGLFYATQFPVRLAAAVYGLVVLNNVLFLAAWAHLAITG